LIVLGSTGPRSSLLGSVSAEVSRRAPCPVVVVPPGADDYGDSDFVDAIVRFGRDSNSEQERTTNDLDARDSAGGIVRFSLGGDGDGR
jgi:hypothetical protein